MTSETPNPSEFLAELTSLPSAERTSRLAGVQDKTQLLAALVDEAMQLTSTDAAYAAAAAQCVMELADVAGDHLSRTRARHARGRALCYTGQFDDALATCREAVSIATRHRFPREAGRAQLASMHALGELGRFDEAISVGEQARSLFESVDDHAFAARADINLGIVHLRADAPSHAITCLDRARPHVADDAVMLGHIDNSRGEALVAINAFGEAEAAFASALGAFERAGAAVTAAIVESNLADLSARQGRLDRALYYFEGARRHLEAAGSRAHVARLLAEEAEAKSVLGVPEDARDGFDHALRELDECGLALEAARARCGLGLTLLRLGEPAAAETALAAAATGFEELGNVTARAKVDLVRAEVALQHDRLPEARRMATKALAQLSERTADAATARHLLARINIAACDEPLADADLAAALSKARELDIAPLLADIYDTRGRLRRRQGRLDEAVEDLAAAAGEIERVRGSLQAHRFRAAFLGHRSTTHAILVETLLDRGAPGDIDRAFAGAEHAKSRTLLDALHHAASPDTEPSGVVDVELRRDLADREAELNALYSRLADDRGSDRAWAKAVRSKERELEDIDARLAARGGRGVAASLTSLADIRARLSRGHALVEYFTVGDALTVFVVTHDDVHVVRDLGPIAAIGERLGRLQFQIGRGLRPGMTPTAAHVDDARCELAALHAIVFEPLVPWLGGIERLTIVPHGLLHAVPFPALWDGRQWLIERMDVHCVPSASLFAHLADLPSGGASVTPLIVANADEIAPRIDDEAVAVARRLGVGSATVVRGGAATMARVRAEAPGASLIHLAVHGRFLPHAPAGSGLRLADGWLTAREIAALSLRADLITLSACETGLNRIDAGDELLGLQRSFLAAGAAALIVSCWRVDDDRTAEFMDQLYSTWHGWFGRPWALARAVAETQRSMCRAHPHPAFWAPFLLVGRP